MDVANCELTLTSGRLVVGLGPDARYPRPPASSHCSCDPRTSPLLELRRHGLHPEAIDNDPAGIPFAEVQVVDPGAGIDAYARRIGDAIQNRDFGAPLVYWNWNPRSVTNRTRLCALI